MPLYSKPENAPTALHSLLLKAVPENEHGNKTLTELARIMVVSRQGINKWIRREKISPERAMQVVALSEGRVKIEDFHPYVYKD